MKKNNSKLTYSVASSNQKSCVAVYNACVLRSDVGYEFQMLISPSSTIPSP